jgi:hypothetical protein
VIKLLQGIKERLALISRGEARLRLVSEVLLPLLERFLESLAGRCDALEGSCLLSERRPGDWATAAGALQAIRFATPILEDWQAAPPLLEMADAARAGFFFALDAQVEVEGLFSAALARLGKLRAQLEETVQRQVSQEFAAGCSRYFYERHELRFAPLPAQELPLDVSATFCEPLSLLRAELEGVEIALPAASVRAIWPRIAYDVEELLFTELVRFVQLSAGGAKQLQRDLEVTISSFAPFTSRPHAVMRRLHDTCLLLRLEPAERASLCTTLAGAQQGFERGVQAQIEEIGIFNLSAAEVRELLVQMHRE